jgi:outer membrane protein W
MSFNKYHYSMIIKNTLLLIIFFTSIIFPQYNGKNFSLSVNGVYTTTAKLFLNPNSTDVTVRNQSFLIEDILNPGLDFRYRLTEPIAIGLNIEYMVKTSSGPNLRLFSGSSAVTVDVEDGFKMIPVELSIHYLLPFSTESFKFFMGGGMGYYFGEQIRKFSDVEVENAERKSAYGIHVSISMDYVINSIIAVRGEMKFRDPQFTVKNRYTKEFVNYEGDVYRIPQEFFDSKINVDGVTFVLGAVFLF